MDSYSPQNHVASALLQRAQSCGKWTRCHTWIITISLTLVGGAWAQDPTQPTPTPTPDPLAGIPVQVLDQQQVTIGSHTITYNRIAPPQFPTPPAATTSSTRSGYPRTASATKRTVKSAARTKRITRSAQDSTPADGGSQKPLKMLFVSATVYDHLFTKLSWYGGATPELSVYVNLDFNYFSGVSTLETADTAYMLVFGLGNDTADSLAQSGQELPDLVDFPSDHSGYQVIVGSPNDHPDDLAQLTAICTYYDANQVQLATAYQQAQAAEAAHQQWMQDHPPVQPNTVINYWPVKNSIFLPKH